MFESKKTFYIIMTFSMFLWGLSWVNGKILSSYITGYEMVVLRHILVVLSLIPILIVTKKYFKISFRSLWLSIIASILMILYVNYFFLGLKHGTAILGGTFVTTLIPIMTCILMAILYKKKTSLKDTFALALGVIGVLTMVHIWTFNLEEIFLPQNIYFFIASILWALITIISSRTKDTSPIIFSFYMYLISAIIVSVFIIDVTKMPFETFDFKFWINLLGISILSTAFATTIYFLGIEKLGAKEVTSFLFLVPFFAILTSYIFLGEKIELSIVVGTILTIIALSILNNIITLKKKSETI